MCWAFDLDVYAHFLKLVSDCHGRLPSMWRSHIGIVTDWRSPNSVIVRVIHVFALLKQLVIEHI
jgi:hypothetical protein